MSNENVTHESGTVFGVFLRGETNFVTDGATLADLAAAIERYVYLLDHGPEAEVAFGVVAILRHDDPVVESLIDRQRETNWANLNVPSVAAIKARKLDGVDCTEEESAIIKGYFDRYHPEGPGATVAEHFPVEHAEWATEVSEGHRRPVPAVDVTAHDQARGEPS